MRLIIIGVIALIVVAGGGFAIVTFLLGGDEEPAAVEEAAEAEPEPVDTTESADLKPMVVPLMPTDGSPRTSISTSSWPFRTKPQRPSDAACRICATHFLASFMRCRR